jgi:type IV pilus assembly protein PilB
MQRVILKGGNDLEIAEQAAREGVRTLRQAGLRKVQEGITGIEEVLAVTNQ